MKVQNHHPAWPCSQNQLRNEGQRVGPACGRDSVGGAPWKNIKNSATAISYFVTFHRVRCIIYVLNICINLCLLSIHNYSISKGCLDMKTPNVEVSKKNISLRPKRNRGEKRTSRVQSSFDKDVPARPLGRTTHRDNFCVKTYRLKHTAR